MNKETDYCLARSKEDIKNFCKKFAEFDCQGCPFFDEEQFDMDEYEEQCM